MPDVLTTINEGPILLSDPLVRQYEAGRKTQTRRVINPQPPIGTTARWPTDPIGRPMSCRYDKAQLWVRQTWRPFVINPDTTGARAFTVQYREGFGVRLPMLAMPMPEHLGWERWPRSVTGNARPDHWRPSIFMRRWAVRNVLTGVSVRAERLQDISDEDIEAEGVDIELACNMCPSESARINSNRDAWAVCWDSINGKRKDKGGRPVNWAANPWVWVVSFDPLPPPVEVIP